ncbi:hypothetical protein ON010_g12865 [Phytophthora cinnamomi]|nr:hypothetical protein ON010_g12865 [Phytophthora cinnamomi]
MLLAYFNDVAGTAETQAERSPPPLSHAPHGSLPLHKQPPNHNGLHDRRSPVRQGGQGSRGEAAQQADRGLAGVLQGHRDHRLARDAGPPGPAQVVHRRALRAREQPEVPPGQPVLEDVRPVRYSAARPADGPAPLQRAGHEQARARRVSAPRWSPSVFRVCPRAYESSNAARNKDEYHLFGGRAVGSIGGCSVFLGVKAGLKDCSGQTAA